MASVIDSKGYRECVGIIILNPQRKVFWGQRIGNRDAWQFPQGGVYKHERPEEALYRELREEVGLNADDVRLIAQTNDWLKYDLPKSMIQTNRLPVCIGQKQMWFLLKLKNANTQISLTTTANPEFSGWDWVDYWLPPRRVISFKRKVYREALKEFAPFVFKHFRKNSKNYRK